MVSHSSKCSTGLRNLWVIQVHCPAFEAKAEIKLVAGWFGLEAVLVQEQKESQWVIAYGHPSLSDVKMPL